jgi:hypothetical protein
MESTAEIQIGAANQPKLDAARFMKNVTRGSALHDDLSVAKPVILKPVHEPITIDVEAEVISNDAELRILLAEANLYHLQRGEHEKNALIASFESGKRLLKAKGLTRSFDECVEKYSTIQRSQAYNYITLAEHPEMVDWAVQSIGQVAPTHLLQLVRLPEEAQEKIKQDFDAGKKVSVSDIKAENKRLKELELENASLTKAIEAKAAENEDLIEQTNALEANFEQAVNSKATQKMVEEKAKHQKELERLNQQLEQAKRSSNSQTEEQIEDKKEELACLQKEIERNQQQLNEIEDAERFNARLNRIATDLIKERANLVMAERPDFDVYPESREKLLSLANEFQAFVKLLEHMALKQTDIAEI